MIDLLPAAGDRAQARSQPGYPLWSRLLLVGLGVLWTLAFAVAYTQWPLFTGKQHTKFLHGMAQAGVGYLSNDWLANTLNPLPAFTWLVSFTHLYLGDAFFYVIQAALLGVYLLSLYGIVAHLFPSLRRGAGPLIFLTLVIAIHSTLLPPFNTQTFGMSVGWLLQSGVAGQYLFNPSFEPGSFGALLILSIYLFLTDRPHWASASAALAAVMHSAYLLTSALLVLAYVSILLWQQRKWLRAIGVGAVALLIVAPLLLYSSTVLGPTTPELWAQAQDIIVNFRIPHHSLPELWIDHAVYARLAVVLVAMLLARKSRLFVILALLLTAAVSLTAAQWLLDSDTLAFLAPWRISVVLVPLSTALIVGKAVSWLAGWLDQTNRYVQLAAGLLAAALLVLLVTRGARAMVDSFQVRGEEPGAPMMAFVAEHKVVGDTYLTPSSMAEFRLTTGAPVVITYKSHPYKDVEVIEWYDRLQAVDAFYAQPGCDQLVSLSDGYGVSHVVMPTGLTMPTCDFALAEIYHDDAYSVWQMPVR